MQETLADFPIIETDRVCVSPLGVDDAAALSAITDVSVIDRISFLDESFTVDAARTLIVGDGRRRDRFLGVWLRATGHLVGTIGMHLRGAGEIEIGYWLASSARGEGLATEALPPVARALAALHPDRRIVAECDPENLPSWRLLRRLGFIETGEAGHRPGRRLLAWTAPG